MSIPYGNGVHRPNNDGIKCHFLMGCDGSCGGTCDECQGKGKL